MLSRQKQQQRKMNWLVSKNSQSSDKTRYLQKINRKFSFTINYKSAEKLTKKGMLFIFNGMLTFLGLFYALRLGNHTHCTLIFIFFEQLFLFFFFFAHSRIKYKQFLNWPIWSIDGTRTCTTTPGLMQCYTQDPPFVFWEVGLPLKEINWFPQKKRLIFVQK